MCGTSLDPPPRALSVSALGRCMKAANGVLLPFRICCRSIAVRRKQALPASMTVRGAAGLTGNLDSHQI